MTNHLPEERKPGQSLVSAFIQGSAKMTADPKDKEANEVPERLRPALARLRNLAKGAWPKPVQTIRFVIERERDYPKNSEIIRSQENQGCREGAHKQISRSGPELKASLSAFAPCET